MKLGYYKFTVDETPYCVWMWDRDKRNKEFISKFEPEYFEYLAKTNHQLLEATNDRKGSQYGAIALRTAYSHGQETFFAILASALQAPQCVPGWLMKYSQQNLICLIEKIHKYKKFLTPFEMKEASWKGIVNLIFHNFTLEDDEQASKIKSNFAQLWQRFASQFLDKKNRDEYNSIKHGLRLNPGGFKLALGIQKDPNIPAEKMESLGGSDFGSTSFLEQRFDKYNFHLIKNSRNWVPENFVHGLNLISVSIYNVQSFLKLVNGTDPKEIQFRWPTDESYFEEPWSKFSGVTEFNLDPKITKENVRLFTKEDILSIYNKN